MAFGDEAGILAVGFEVFADPAGIAPAAIQRPHQRGHTVLNIDRPPVIPCPMFYFEIQLATQHWKHGNKTGRRPVYLIAGLPVYCPPLYPIIQGLNHANSLPALHRPGGTRIGATSPQSSGKSVSRAMASPFATARSAQRDRHRPRNLWMLPSMAGVGATQAIRQAILAAWKSATPVSGVMRCQRQQWVGHRSSAENRLE